MPRREQDPFGNFRFKLELGDVEVAGFAECTGLNIETKVMEYKEGGNNATTLKFPEPSTFGNVTLKRGVTNSNELIEWQLDVVAGTFSKNARKLTLLQAATLAGLPQAPSVYDPFHRPQAALARRKEVLRAMLSSGFSG